MRVALLLGLCLLLGLRSAHAGAAVVQDGPLAPCAPQQANGDTPAPQQAWGVEIAGAFTKEEALAEFDRIKQEHADLLGDYAPIMVATCDLHMGTALRYSARIGMDSRDAAEALCGKLQAAGGACVIAKN